MNNIDKYKIAIERCLYLVMRTDQLQWYIGPCRTSPQNLEVRITTGDTITEFALQSDRSDNEERDTEFLLMEMLRSIVTLVENERQKACMKLYGNTGIREKK